MNFYTSLIVGTIAFLIFMLIIVGYCMSLSKTNQIYPTAIASCPDYYSLDPFDNSFCIIGSNISVTDVSCKRHNFTKDEYMQHGTDYESGNCKKKLWANNCNVQWDGITNNDSLCYT